MIYNFNITFDDAIIEEMAKVFKKKADLMRNTLQYSLYDAAREIRKSAEKKAPRLTGYLRNSSYIVKGKKGGGAIEYSRKPISNTRTRHYGYYKDNRPIQESLTFVNTMTTKGWPAVSIGFYAGHAYFVHELHKTSPNFLNLAVNESVPKVKQLMLERLRKAWQRRVK